jgi:hypothetical protein
MLKKESCQCVPIDSIRNQVQRKYDNIKCDAGIHEKTWNRYPCALDEKNLCQVDHCNGKISFAVMVNFREIKIITALFIRTEKKAYAYFNRSLRSLFENNLVNPVPFVTKELDIPIITEPTKLADPSLPFRR